MATSGSGPVTVGTGCTGPCATLLWGAFAGASSPQPIAPTATNNTPANAPPLVTERLPTQPIVHLRLTRAKHREGSARRTARHREAAPRRRAAATCHKGPAAVGARTTRAWRSL